jgi:hypothetical protein
MQASSSLSSLLISTLLLLLLPIFNFSITLTTSSSSEPPLPQLSPAPPGESQSDVFGGKLVCDGLAGVGDVVAAASSSAATKYHDFRLLARRSF